MLLTTGMVSRERGKGGLLWGKERGEGEGGTRRSTEGGSSLRIKKGCSAASRDLGLEKKGAFPRGGAGLKRKKKKRLARVPGGKPQVFIAVRRREETAVAGHEKEEMFFAGSSGVLRRKGSWQGGEGGTERNYFVWKKRNRGVHDLWRRS